MKRLLLLLVCVLSLARWATPSYAASTSIFDHIAAGTITAVHGIDVTQTADKTAHVLGNLLPSERILVIGRVGNGWLRIRSRFGVGYIPASAVQLEDHADSLPLVAGNLPAPTLPAAIPVDDLSKYPVLPTVTDYSRQIYETGIRMGNNPGVFSKIGDCMTADNELFLGKFGMDRYNLGNYRYLQPVIDYYSKVPLYGKQQNSWVAHSVAAYKGFNAGSVEDSTWADPTYCSADDTPLSCEYNLAKPGVALIMFGTSDVVNLTLVEFDFYLRLVIHDTIAHGVVPLMSTFPGDPYYKEKTLQINQIILQVAHEYNVPSLNLWGALQPLPGHGRNAGSMYLSRLLDTDVANFNQTNLQYGYTLRNLLTIQALDILWRDLIQPTF